MLYYSGINLLKECEAYFFIPRQPIFHSFRFLANSIETVVFCRSTFFSLLCVPKKPSGGKQPLKWLESSGRPAGKCPEVNFKFFRRKKRFPRENEQASEERASVILFFHKKAKTNSFSLPLTFLFLLQERPNFPSPFFLLSFLFVMHYALHI